MNQNAAILTLPQVIPTELEPLADLIASRQGRVVDDLYDALVAQEGAQRAAEVWDHASALAEQTANITMHEETLHDAITAAECQLGRAQTAISRLTHGDARHIEYVEGSAGADITTLLGDAGRLVRAARALLAD